MARFVGERKGGRNASRRKTRRRVWCTCTCKCSDSASRPGASRPDQQDFYQIRRGPLGGRPAQHCTARHGTSRQSGLLTSSVMARRKCGLLLQDPECRVSQCPLSANTVPAPRPLMASWPHRPPASMLRQPTWSQSGASGHCARVFLYLVVTSAQVGAGCKGRSRR